MKVSYNDSKQIINQFPRKDMLFNSKNALGLYMSLYEDATTLNKQPIFKNGKINPIVEKMVVPVALKLYDQIVMIYEQGLDESELDIPPSRLEETLEQQESPKDNSVQLPLLDLPNSSYDETSHLKPNGKRRK